MEVTIKKVDKLGRIVLPINYRKALGLQMDSEVILGMDNGVITAEPAVTPAVFAARSTT